jgi:adenosylhomocysteine nucleosidase
MKSTLIICALQEELDAVKAQFNAKFEEIEISRALNLSCHKYQIGEEIFYTVLSGMGPINASLRLGLVLSQLPIHQVLLLGVAGGLTAQTKIGDLVISSAVIQHDYYSSLEAGNFVMKSGDLILSKEQSKNYNPMIYADNDLIQKCLKTKLHSHQIFQGVVASGSEFVGRIERKNLISGLHPQTLAVDMEACAVANVCHLFGIPFVVAKTISDTLHTDGTIESDFVKFLNFASQNASEVVKSFINETSVS